VQRSIERTTQARRIQKAGSFHLAIHPFNQKNGSKTAQNLLSALDGFLQKWHEDLYQIQCNNLYGEKIYPKSSV
jgi:hypothetical protein